jgi:hypothetical protein
MPARGIDMNRILFFSMLLFAGCAGTRDMCMDGVAVYHPPHNSLIPRSYVTGNLTPWELKKLNSPVKKETSWWEEK